MLFPLPDFFSDPLQTSASDSDIGTLWTVQPARLTRRLDLGRPDHRAPLFGFIGDELAEVAGQTRNRRAAKIGKPRFQFGIGKSCVDFPIELPDDLDGRNAGRTE